MDGIVVKVDDLALRRKMGEGTKAPDWAAAWKFPPLSAVTAIREIRWTTGRTGRRTPVAELEPTFLGKVQVSRVSLHSAGEIKRLGITAGDQVVIGLIGDAAPQLLEVVGKDYDSSVPGISVKTPIDACLTNTPGCREQYLARLLHFISREGINIAGVGKARLLSLIDAGLLPDIPSILLLKEGAVAKVAGFGETSARRLVTAIQTAGHPKDFRLLRAIGIQGVGKTAVDRLEHRFPSLDALLIAGEEQLKGMKRSDVDGIRTIQRFFSTSGGAELLMRFRQIGLLHASVD